MRSRSTLVLLLLLSIGFITCKKNDPPKAPEAPTHNTSLPVVNSLDFSGIGSYSVTCMANVSAKGGSELTAVGICWDTQADPTINNNFIKYGSGMGNITLSITGLDPSTLYHVRAYATNASGTSYSEDKQFTTAAAPVVIQYLGRYNHTNGQGAYFEFIDGSRVRYGGPSGFVDGTYTMLSAKRVKINLGLWGEGDFSDDFKSLMLGANVFTR